MGVKTEVYTNYQNVEKHYNLEIGRCLWLTLDQRNLAISLSVHFI